MAKYVSGRKIVGSWPSTLLGRKEVAEAAELLGMPQK
jgi:hypothetical protein